MTDAGDEAAWLVEFERDGERGVHDTLYHGSGFYPEPKRQAAIRWLREQESKRVRREEQTQRYVLWTLVAAIAAVIVGVIGVIVALRH